MTGIEVCRDCVIERAIHFAEKNFPNKEDVETFKEKVVPGIKALATPEHFHEMDAIWTQEAKKILGIDDLYLDEKIKFQSAFLEIKDEIAHWLDDSKDLMFDAFKLAAAGNIVDFACFEGLVLDYAKKTVEEVRKKPFDRKLYERYMDDLSKAKSMAYLLDNVGEDVFDTIYMSKLKEHFPNLKIYAIAKGLPASSDSTVEDAKKAGMEEFAEIVSTGSDVLGTVYSACTPYCQSVLDNADVILGKGMANLENMVGSKYNAYYLSLCKCKKMYADILGFPMQEIIFLADRGFDNSRYCKGKWTWEVDDFVKDRSK